MNFIKPLNHKISLIENQLFYGEKVGVYVIEEQDKIIVVDLPTYSKNIEDHLLSFKKPLICFLSHGSCGIPDGTKWQKQVGLTVYVHELDKNDDWIMMAPDVLYKDPPTIAPGIELIFTPGHTPGSICLLEKETKSLFTGDTFGGNKDGTVWDFFKGSGMGDLEQRFESCKMLLKYDFEHVLPFHYDMILKNGKTALQNFVHSR